MKPRSRVFVATAVTAVLLGVLVLGLTVTNRPSVPARFLETTRRIADSVKASAPEVTKVPVPPAPLPEKDRPIEDQLAEVGEDPGGVYYVSRIREAMTEGNPPFARELFRQMKEEHPRSALLAEAEALLRGVNR